MNKKIISIILLILLIISVFILSVYYRLNNTLPKENLTSISNLYEYDILKEDNYLIAIKNDGKNLYYVTGIKEENETDDKEKEYSFIQFNIIKNKVVNEVKFKSKNLYGAEIIFSSEFILLVSTNDNNINIFDKNLNFIKNTSDIEEHLLGNYDNKTFYIKDKNIYLDNKIYDEIDKECGSANKTYYFDKNVYITFNSENHEITCVYNMELKKMVYTDKEQVKLFKNGYMFYSSYDNEIIKRFNGKEEKIYLDDFSESYNFDVNKKGNFIASIDSEFNLKVYNINTNRVLYSTSIKEIKEEYIDKFFIDDYVYYVKNNGTKEVIYIWNYKEENVLNRNMKVYNKIDYRFDNIKKINELNEKYGINIYAYDESVRYFYDFYALPSNDDALIKSTLSHMEKILSNFNKTFFKSFKFGKNNGVKIYLNKKLGPSDINTQISNPAGYTSKINNDYIIAIDISSGNFEQTFCHELMHTIENNMDDLYVESKINFLPFYSWGSLNPSKHSYQYSYVEASSYDYTIGSEMPVYFVDYYSHTFPTEDRARIFENFCAPTEDNVLNKYPNLKKKAKNIKSFIIKTYPSMENSELFKIIK